MDGAIYMGWLNYFRRVPPGDHEVHWILANIWATVFNMLRGEGSEARSPYDIAPHLKPIGYDDEKRKQIVKAQAEQVALALNKQREKDAKEDDDAR